MLTRKSLIQETDSLIGLRGFVEVYEEIAAGRMQKVRAAVLLARQFLAGLAEVFAEVKLAYAKQAGPAAASQSKLNKNGRTVAVFLSANSGLYGDIVERTFEDFIRFLADTSGSPAGRQADAVIVGKLGLRLLNERRPDILYNYFDLSDDQVDLDSLRLIVRYLLQFEKIMVFYGKFTSLVNQVPTTSSISGDSLPSVDLTQKAPYQYLFEPSAGSILQIFESEILASIFEQTLHESLLAKFASRLQHLDRSLQNIDRRLGQVRYTAKRLRHELDNRKQLSRLSGMALWEQ